MPQRRSRKRDRTFRYKKPGAGPGHNSSSVCGQGSVVGRCAELIAETVDFELIPSDYGGVTV